MKAFFALILKTYIMYLILFMFSFAFSEEPPGWSKEEVLAFAKNHENHARFTRLQEKYMVDLDNWYIGMSVMEICDFISNEYPEKSKKAREMTILGSVPLEKYKINEKQLKKKGIAGIYNDWTRKFCHINTTRKAILLALASDLSKTEKIGGKFYNALSMAVKLSIAYCPDLALDLAELDVLLNKSNSASEKKAVIRLILIRRNLGLDNEISLPTLRSTDKRIDFLKELAFYMHEIKNQDVSNIINNDIEMLKNKIEKIQQNNLKTKKRKKKKLPWCAAYIIKSQNKGEISIKEDLKKEILSISDELYSITKLEKEISSNDLPNLISYANKILGRWNQMTAGLLLRYLDTGKSEYVITPQELIFIGIAIERKLKVQAIPIYTFAGQLGVIGKKGDSKARRGHDWFNAMESGIYVGFVMTNMDFTDEEAIEPNNLEFSKAMQRLSQYSIVISNDPSKWKLFPYMYSHKEMTKFYEYHIVDRLFEGKDIYDFLFREIKNKDLGNRNLVSFRMGLIVRGIRDNEYEKILPIIREEASGEFDYPVSTVAGISSLLNIYWKTDDEKYRKEAMRYAENAIKNKSCFTEYNQKKLKWFIDSNGIYSEYTKLIDKN